MPDRKCVLDTSLVKDRKLVDGRYVYTADCATTLIKKLFELEVDENTYVITTNREHDNVTAIVNELPHTALTVTEIQSCDFKRIPTNYEKYFVYMIGTDITGGQITNSYTFKSLKRYLGSERTTLAIDACQEIVDVRNDYLDFDYKVQTGHSWFMYYDLGILYSKRKLGLDFHQQAYQTLISMRANFIHTDLLTFNARMENEFGCWLTKHGYQSVSELPTMFSMKVDAPLLSTCTEDEYKMLDRYGVRIEGLKSLEQQWETNGQAFVHLRIRGQHYIVHPEHLERGIELAHKVLTQCYKRHLLGSTRFDN